MDEHMILLEKLQEDILTIIAALNASDSIGVPQSGSGSSKSTSSHPPRMCLLEIACLGNPEKTIQGEIVSGLRALGWNAVQEAGYIHNKRIRRNLDILVFDKDNADKRILSVIEMKHLSSHQGKPMQLAQKMEADYNLPRPPRSPIMLLGFYTTVRTITNRPMSPTGIYRFPKTYCKKDHLTPSTFASDFHAWSLTKTWLLPPVSSSHGLKMTGFTIIEGSNTHDVSGQVEFFIGIRQ